MTLKELIKYTEKDLFDIKHSRNIYVIAQAQIRINVRLQTVEAVDEDSLNIFTFYSEDKRKDWEKLKKLLGLK